MPAGALQALRQEWEAACAGTGGVVLLAGEPGSGKTRLAREFAGGADVRYGRALEEPVAPYQPLAEALRCAFDGALASAGDPVGARYRFFERVAAGLADSTRRRR